jgi:hypothetical protein
MEEIKNTQEEPQKATYEQLENYVNQLSQQNMILKKKLSEFAEESFYKKMEFLFKVLENKDSFTIDFVNSCASEIMEAMNINANSNTEE